MNKKGIIGTWFFFTFIAVTMIFFFALMSPMLVRYNSAMYVEGEKLIRDANGTISAISNVEVRESIQTQFASSIDSTQLSIETNNALFKYGWIILLVMLFVFFFVFVRNLQEVNRTGFT